MTATAIIPSSAVVTVTADPLSAPPPRTAFAIFTRAMGLAAGLQSVTGIGFQPRRISLRMSISGTTVFTIGTATPASQGCYQKWSDGTWYIATVPPYYTGIAASDPSNYQTFVVSSFDVDGFTLSWTKVLNPVGTATIHAECFR